MALPFLFSRIIQGVVQQKLQEKQNVAGFFFLVQAIICLTLFLLVYGCAGRWIGGNLVIVSSPSVYILEKSELCEIGLFFSPLSTYYTRINFSS